MGNLTFRQFLAEAPTGKLMHLTHLEDLILDGAAGASEAVEILGSFGDMLENGGVSSALNVTVKWDGAPSVVFGPDPADGRFFVATKSAFNKTPKLMKSLQDIQDMYGSGGLGEKLRACFTELALLQPKQVLQGDLLFTDDTTTQTLDGVSYVTFRPNTILYAVDVNSHLGERIRRATLGIVIHTMYVGAGKDLGSYRSAPITPSVFAGLKKTNRVVVLDAAFDDVSGTASFTQGEYTDFMLLTQSAVDYAAKVPDVVWNAVANEPLHSLIAQFQNQQVRAGGLFVASVAPLMIWLKNKLDAERKKRTSAAGQAAVERQYRDLMTLVRTNFAGFNIWFRLHATLSNAKLMLIQKLAGMTRIQSFLPTADGYKVSGPEGFVAVAHNGRMVKLVDRLNFSRANFLAPKSWG